jgi:YggT family protein
MFVFGNFLSAAAAILDQVLWVYNLVVFVSVALSWVSADPFNPIVRALRSVTEPVFDWVRRRLPFAMLGMLDLSPMIVLFAIWFARLFLVRSLLDVAARLR